VELYISDDKLKPEEIEEKNLLLLHLKYCNELEGNLEERLEEE
jgi:hypothetical protein